MGTEKRDDESGRNTEVVRHDDWFRPTGKRAWDLLVHKEYGVLWSQCGIRTVFAETESAKAVPEDGVECPRCVGRRR